MQRLRVVSLRIALGVALLAASASGGRAASGGGITVSPTGASLSARQPSAALTVTNNEPDSTIFQVRAFSWTNAEGKEQFGPADGILVVPPVMTLAPGESRIVRIALRHAPSGSREQAYRLVIAEVPPKIQGAASVQFSLIWRLPVFVEGEASRPALLDWTVRESGKTLEFTATNRGDVHVKLLELNVYDDIGRKQLVGTSAGGYVLPGESQAFSVPLSAALSTGAVVLEARPQTGAPVYATLAVNPHI